MITSARDRPLARLLPASPVAVAASAETSATGRCWCQGLRPRSSGWKYASPWGWTQISPGAGHERLTPERTPRHEAAVCQRRQRRVAFHRCQRACAAPAWPASAGWRMSRVRCRARLGSPPLQVDLEIARHVVTYSAGFYPHHAAGAAATVHRPGRCPWCKTFTGSLLTASTRSLSGPPAPGPATAAVTTVTLPAPSSSARRYPGPPERRRPTARRPLTRFFITACARRDGSGHLR